MTTGSETQGGAEAGTGKTAAPQPPRLSVCFGIVGAFWILLLVVAYLLGRFDLVQRVSDSWLLQAVGAVVAAAIGAWLWEIRRWLMRTLTSLPFSVAVLAFLLVLTAIGTVILQQAPPQAYVARHGAALAAVLLTLGMDDLFHTVWFTGLLALIPVSLVLTVIERRAWRLHMWGHMLSHLGFVVVMLGGWYGSHNGFKGIIDLHEGEIVHEAHLLGKDGARGPSRPLGFSLKLERFAVETYAPEAKFYIYEREGDGYRPIRSFDLKEAGTTHGIGSSGASFHLVKAYPNFYLEPVVREVPAGQGAPILQVDFKQGDWASRAALLAGVTGRDRTMLSAEGPPARFVWAAPTEAEIARFAEGSAERHIISLRLPQSGADPEEVAVSPGKPGVLASGGFEVTILEYLPEFSYNSQTKTASTLSQEPNNPAVRVLIKDQKTNTESSRWLFAKMPDFGHSQGAAEGPKFVYRYEPSSLPAAREFLVVGEANQLWRLDQGKVVKRIPIDQWQTACEGLPVSGMRIFASGVVESVPTTRSAAWDHPAADIVLDEGGATRELRMLTEHGQPVALADGKTFLAFEMRAEEPKSFQSHLTVYEDGRKMTEKTIVVNDPLSYKGFMLYQSNFNKDDPTYSGILAVKDPGLGIVFVGFVMMSIGVIFIYYIRPRLIAGDSHGN
jgi:hypothetical protein